MSAKISAISPVAPASVTAGTGSLIAFRHARLTNEAGNAGNRLSLLRRSGSGRGMGEAERAWHEAPQKTEAQTPHAVHYKRVEHSDRRDTAAEWQPFHREDNEPRRERRRESA